jgi:hypothetical protein
MSFQFNPFTGNFDLVGQGVWSKFADAINGSSSKTIDTISISDFVSVVYKVTLYNTVEGKAKSLEITVNNSNGTLKDFISGKLGANINFSIDAVVNSGNLELNITNNETYNLDVSIARLTL